VDDSKKAPPKLSRRGAFLWTGSALIGGAFACVEASAGPVSAEPVNVGTGPCSYCSCPAFVPGNDWAQTCQRCGHAWTYHA
jgi:hypothetical protein